VWKCPHGVVLAFSSSFVAARSLVSTKKAKREEKDEKDQERGAARRGQKRVRFMITSTQIGKTQKHEA